jgi:hypothetical protein
MADIVPLINAGYLIGIPIERPVIFTITIASTGTYSSDNTWQIRESNATTLDLTQTYPIAASTVTAGNNWSGWSLGDISVITNVSPTLNYTGTYVFDTIDAHGDGWNGNWKLTIYSTDANGVSSFRLSTVGPGSGNSLLSEFLETSRYVMSNPLTKTTLKNMIATGNGYTIQQLIGIDLFTNNDVHALFTTIDDIYLLSTTDYGSQNVSQLITLGYSRNEIHKAGFPIWVPLGSPVTGGSAGSKSGHSTAINEYGNIIAIGAPLYDGITGINHGQVQVYTYVEDTWVQMGQDIEGETSGDKSGTSIALSSDGTILAIGSPYNSGANGIDSGSVQVYEYGMMNDVLSWNMRGNSIEGDLASDESGSSVSISSNGNILAIGSPLNAGNGTGSGHTRVYEYISGIWTKRGNTINGEGAGDFSGGAVSLSNDGSILAIGAYGDIFNSGTVRVYEYSTADWIQKGGTIVGETADNFSGNSVSLNGAGNVIAIGAYGNSNQRGVSGHVRVYGYDSNKTQEEYSQYSSYFGPVGWTRLGNDIDGESSGDYSGYSVSLYSGGSSVVGSVVAIGAFGNDGNGIDSGHVRIYKLHYTTVDGAYWNQFGIDIDGATTGDNSGKSVSLSGDGTNVIIGAPSSDPNNMDSAGQVRIFKYEIDTVLPVIYLEGDAIITIMKGNTYIDAGATAIDNINGPITSYMTTSGTVNTTVSGTYTIVYNVSDYSGNAAVPVTRTVMVLSDNTPPVIYLIGDATITIIKGDTYNDAGATATDNIDGTITGNIIATGTVNTIMPGTYTIIYTVLDSDGNAATPVTRTIVVVEDVSSPVIIMNGSTLVNLILWDTYTDAGATATDNMDGIITSNIITTGTVDTSVVGTYTITYSVSDSAGNIATPISRTIVVTTPPLTTKTLEGIVAAADTVTTSTTFVNYLAQIGVSDTTGIYNQHDTIVNNPHKAYTTTITIPQGNFHGLTYTHKLGLIGKVKTLYATHFNVNENNIGIMLKNGSIIIEVTILNDTVVSTELPNVPTCFPKGTHVTIDQGKIAIETLSPDIHTIHGRKIIAISQTRPLQKHIICFQQDSLGKNIPSQETLCSKEHKIFYKGEMKTACEISNICEKVTKVPYHGDPLYNVLLEKHDKMVINNMICETLHPKNIMARISVMKDGPEKRLAVRKLNQRIESQ